jgi:hypothetical protein
LIHHAVAPRSPEWHALRLGIATSSEFHKIVKPAALLKESGSANPDYSKVLSKQAADYMHRLIAEQITGAPCENYESQWMSRGTELEDKAILAYEMLTDTETHPGGFITTDDGLLGCSPDRLIGGDGDLELKCPLIQTQVGYALGSGVDEDYMVQLQGRLLIHEREYVDIFSYHPALTVPPIKVYRKESYIKILRRVLEDFNEVMLAKRLELEQRYGPFLRPEPDEAPDHSDDFLTQADEDMIVEGLKREGKI